ncbi:hypothetical protein PISMIDRAFT_17488 [Pisolithus microcarpus 441]|uniref:Uncharacterized protein n=1 Tax=Pisolithus microcarpus 441 TaxID=765257 RepID=A0A0C9YVE5_9AGAM|nr:hypothetical protein PISMIDRAFT_17488 [Pisolithus microcarpus 441]
MHDHDLHIWQLYAQYPSIFIKLIKSWFQLLCKKYNDANKTLGATRAGLTAMELREKLEMKRLLNKILDTFPWWEDLHGFWRTNLPYNTVFSTGDLGQDFVMEAQQFFAGEKNAVAKEDEGLECDNESSHVLDMQVLPHPEVAYDPSVSAATPISPPASIYSKVTASTMTSFSKTFSQSVLADITSPSTTGVLKSLSLHAVEVGATTSTEKDKGKGKVTTDANSMSLGIPPHAPSSSSSSAACKHLWDPGSDISSKLSKASDSLMQQIQNSAEAKSESKWMRIQAEIIGKELRACDKSAQ